MLRFLKLLLNMQIVRENFAAAQALPRPCFTSGNFGTFERLVSLTRKETCVVSATQFVGRNGPVAHKPLPQDLLLSTQPAPAMGSNEYPSLRTRGESGLGNGIGVMANCKFCGVEIEFATLGGLNIPIDPDFGDHRASCSARTVFSQEKLRDRNHEARVRDFLRKAGATR